MYKKKWKMIDCNEIFIFNRKNVPYLPAYQKRMNNNNKYLNTLLSTLIL